MPIRLTFEVTISKLDVRVGRDPNFTIEIEIERKGLWLGMDPRFRGVGIGQSILLFGNVGILRGPSLILLSVRPRL